MESYPPCPKCGVQPPVIGCSYPQWDCPIFAPLIEPQSALEHIRKLTAEVERLKRDWHEPGDACYEFVNENPPEREEEC